MSRKCPENVPKTKNVESKNGPSDEFDLGRDVGELRVHTMKHPGLSLDNSVP
jgi:hypothetical protein